MMNKKSAFLLVCLLGAAVRCGDGEEAIPCLAGEEVDCTCAEGQRGLRLCRSDLTLGECLCGDELPSSKNDPRSQGADSGEAVFDGGALQNEDGASGITPLPDGARRLFVTSTRYTGKLSAYGREGQTTAQAADELCNQAARAAELEGTWTAWLSTDTVDAIERIQGEGPWYTLTGVKVFNNKDNLATVPLAPFTTDERGRQDSLSLAIWTGTRAGGRRAGDTCAGWLTEGHYYSGLVGYLYATDSSWTSGATAGCYEEHHLLCLER